jgi:NMT1-like family
MMPKAITYTLLSIRDLVVSLGPFIALAVLLLGLAYWWLDPTPPRHITLATGPEQSAYDEFGKRYAKMLAVQGITVNIVRSEGSSANLQLLREGKADLGFVQGGSAEQLGDEEGLSSLGSLFLEPVWLFYREDAAKKVNPQGRLNALSQLQGMRVNVGTAGSGVPSLMNKLFEANRVDMAQIKLGRLDQTPATVAFLGAEVDAIVFASAPESLMVQMLLQTPGVRLFDFAQSEAYSRRFAFLSPVVLPRGVVDLAADNPSQDVRLVAPTTTLLARDSTHPALVQLFSQAAAQLHGGAGWFNRARQYPNVENNELPLAKEAERFIKNGPPLLQRYLPFWMANLIERMWVALGIIVAILLPLSRIIPPLYAFRIRSRVFRWYGQLRDIENRADASDPALGPRDSLLAELNQLDAKAEKIQVPLSYVDELYALRGNIHLVRKKLLRI